MAQEGSIPRIALSRVHKSFGRQVVLNNLRLTVHSGETLAVLGRSGVGKSVLLKILVGLESPDSGSVVIDNREIVGATRSELNLARLKIGFLFQYAALYDSLTAAENVAFPLKRHTRLPENERKARALELLSRVGVENAAHKLPSEISGGMRKRVALARALALDPEILLCDEPTAGLDPITAAEIDELISIMQQERGMTSVVVTHDLESAKRISTIVALLHQGTLLFHGPFAGLAHSDHPFIKKFLQPGIPRNEEESCPERRD